MSKADRTAPYLREVLVRKHAPVRAALVVVLESHAGRWNTLAFLANRVVAPTWLVETLCDDLVAHGQAMQKLYFGEPIFGIAIVADYPGINDVRDCAGDPGVCVGGFAK